MINMATAETAVLADLTHNKRRKIPALTGIRGYASLWVVVHHCVNLGWHQFTGTWASTNQIPFLISGYLGVELFFILSGFILTKIYGPELSNFPGLRDFFVGRFFRILPVWWFSLIFFALAGFLIKNEWSNTTEHGVFNWILCFFLIQSWFGHPTAWNVPGWSLSAEWLAYIVFPILALIFLKIRHSSNIIGCALIFFITLLIFYYHRGLSSLNDVSRFGLVRCLCEFTIGIALARLHQQGLNGARVGNGLLIAGLILLLPPMVHQRFDFLAIIAFSFLVLSAGSHSTLAHALFGNRIAHFLGEISFSVYVLHWLLLELVLRFVPAGSHLLYGLAAVPVAVIPIAWTSWRWVEIPGQAAGRIVTGWLRARDAARRAPAISSAR